MRFQPKTEAEVLNLLPAGEYDFLVKDAEDKTSQAGNDMIKSVGSFFGLNALPVVLPLAAISASIAAIAYWLSDFDKLRGDIYTEMVESGTKPEKAAQILATIKPDQGGISNTLITNFLPLAGIAVVLWWVFGREK